MSGRAGQQPGTWVVRRIRGGDLIRAVIQPAGKAKGRCLDESCDWPGPVGTTPHNISRELCRHTRRTGHRTRFTTVEITEYRQAAVPRPRSSGRPEDS